MALWGPLLDRLNLVAEADRRAAPDRRGWVSRWGQLPGAGGDTARRWGLPVRPGVVGRSGDHRAAWRERAAERVDALAVSGRRGPGPGGQGGGGQPGPTAPGLGGRGRARGRPAHDRPERHPGGGLRPGQAGQRLLPDRADRAVPAGRGVRGEAGTCWRYALAAVRLTTDKAMTDKAMTDKAMTDKAMTDKAMTDKAMTDKAMQLHRRVRGRRPDRGPGTATGAGSASTRPAT